MPKRGANEGSIYKDEKRTRWVACLTLGFDTNTGKRIRKYRYAKTRAEANEKLQKMMEQFAHATYHDIDKITVGQWLQKWYTTYAENRIRPNTRLSYQDMLRINQKHLGHIRLSKLHSVDIQSMINDMAANKTIDGKMKKGLSRRTCQYALAILKMAIKRAINDGLIHRSPIVDIKLPAKKRKEITPLKNQDWNNLLQQATLIENQNPDTHFGFRTILLLEFATGLRRCEILGLQHQDIDFKTKTLQVRRSLVIDDHKKPTLGPTKTTSSSAQMQLPDFIITELQAYKKAQSKKILACKQPWQHKEMIFTDKVGNFINPNVFTTRFLKFIKALNIKSTFHNLRHDLASRMINNDIDVKTIQETLRHSNISTTLDIYTHILQEKHKKVANWLDEESKNIITGNK